MKNIEAANHTKSPALASIPEQQAVTLPYVAPFVSIEIKPEYRARASQIVKDLMASDPAVQVAELAEPYRLIGPLASDPAIPGLGIRAYSRPMPADESISKLPKTRSILAVLDSGITQGDLRFDDLWRNPRLGQDGRDLDFDFLRDDVNGFDFVNWKAFPLDDVSSHHGTHVAGIATQRLGGPGIQSAVNERLELMILKVADSGGLVYQASVDNAVAFAAGRGVRVANMSFAGQPSVSLQTKFAEARNILFVVAAGNQSIDADTNDSSVYPAKFAAKLPNVISVAAFGSDAIAEKSNYGARSVDIAAPGVDIESTVLGGTARLSGSSQAAPLVAYVAALLASSGFRSPEAIRHRIIDSADVLPSLRGKIASEGVIDPAKAISFTTDLVELSDHTLLRGTVKAPARLLLSNGQAVPMKQVSKIVFGYSDDPAKELRVTWTDGDIRRVDTTSRMFDAITLSHDGVDETISAVNLRDLVSASQP